MCASRVLKPRTALLAPLIAASLLLAGCVAHEKDGDRAAALGDWRAAYGSYREALSREPESPVLKEKYDRSRREAAVDAFRKAQGCIARENFQCALNELDFALTLDSGNVEYAELRSTAARAMALALLARARGHLQQRQYAEALGWLERALSVASLPEVQAGAVEVRHDVGKQAAEEAEGLRSQRQFVQAISLLELAVRAAPEHAPALEAVRTEYEAYRTAEYERLALEGDDELAKQRWAEAGSKYRAALAAKPGGRAQMLAQFADGLAQGEDSIAQRNFERAASGFRKAMASGLDGQGIARKGLDSVEIRAYRVRIRELMVSPAQPDGRAWVGPRNKLIDQLVKTAAVAAGTYFAPGVGGKIAGVVVGQMQSVPPENVPVIHVEVVGPEGPALTTVPVKKLYVVLESAFVVTGNAYDERKIALRVIGQGDSVQDVGVFDLRIGDLVRNGGFAGNSQSVLGLKLEVDAVSPQGAPAFSEMRPLPDATNEASGYSEPQAGATAYRLTKVGGAIANGDYGNEMGMDGPPDLAIQILQAGRTVFYSPKAPDQASASWAPQNVFLYVVPGERLTVKVWDLDLQDNDLVLTGEFSAEDLRRGEVVLKTQRGSWVGLKALLTR